MAEVNELIFEQQWHGRNVKIDESGKEAQKIKKGAKEALVLTNRILMLNELFEVELGGAGGFKGVKGEVKARMKGKESVRIGVTVQNPKEVCSVPQSMKRTNSGTWMMKSEEIIENGETVQSLQKYNLKEVSIGDRVGIVRVPEFNGSLVVYINGAPIGVIATSVPAKVYGFIELQGDCEHISLCTSRTIKNEALPTEIRAMREREMEIRKLQQQLMEKDDLVQILEDQLEMMRKQLLAKQSSSNGSHDQNGTEHRETQTAQNGKLNHTDGGESIGGDSTSSSSRQRRRRRKMGCCTVS